MQSIPQIQRALETAMIRQDWEEVRELRDQLREVKAEKKLHKPNRHIKGIILNS